MIEIDKKLILVLFDKAVVSDRKRMNYDLCTSAEDGSQRMLNALLQGTVVPVHRHPRSNENVLCLKGRLVEVVFEEETTYDNDDDNFPMTMESGDVVKRTRLLEKERIVLDPAVGNFGCVVPAGAWHTVGVLEPSVIYEAKDGKYGEDGSETFGTKTMDSTLRQAQGRRSSPQVTKTKTEESVPESCLGDLKEQITYLIGMERHSGSMEVITPLYVSRMLNVPVEEVEKAMREMGIV